MEPVEAFAILMVGAFVTVLVTALFYRFTVRPRLLEPVSMSALGMLDHELRDELLQQRTSVNQLNTALARHTERMEATATVLAKGDELTTLKRMLKNQMETVQTLSALLNEQTNRLTRQETVLAGLSHAQVEGVQSLRGSLFEQGEVLAEIDTRLARQQHSLMDMAQSRATAEQALQGTLDDQARRLIQLEERLGQHDTTLLDITRTHTETVQTLRSVLDEHRTQQQTTLSGLTQSQRETVESVRGAVEDLTSRLDNLDERLAQQEGAQNQAVEQMASVSGSVLPGLAAQLSGQDNHLGRLEGKVDALADSEGLARLEVQVGQIEQRVNSLGSGDQLSALIDQQSQKLVEISGRLDAWADSGGQQDDKLAEHARVLAQLDREMAAQAELSRQLDVKVNEHTTMLVTAAKERREQAGLLDRVLKQVGDVFSAVNKIVASPPQPPRPTQERLTDIKGIGPVYSTKLNEAGIFTYEQLAELTPEEVTALIGRSTIDAEGWVEQAKLLASQRQKVEGDS
ncbi:MAG: hypothetical protein GYB65_10335 [Chloroflexi bacterium]|nr:hypothetical protein [Chloroflexota bacterium]